MKRLFVVAVLSSLLGGCVSTLNAVSSSSAPYRGIGYATVSNQPGKTLAQKQLMAIRASRLMAMRDLAEKIHGLNVDAYTSVAEGTMLNDSLRGGVMGLVRGARVVSITPTRANVYETILEVDASEVSAMRSMPRAQPYR